MGSNSNRSFAVRNIKMHQEGLEPSAYRLEGGCSIRLSYWCKVGSCQQTLPESTETLYS